MADAIADIRRLVYGLRPPALDELGLIEALRQGASGLQGGTLEIDIEAPPAMPPLSAATEVALFRIAQEAITNAARHAQPLRCTVRFEVTDRDIRLLTVDDGKGIAPDHLPGVGLRSMRERAEDLGGTCEILPGPGGGTAVIAVLPLLSPTGEAD
jgi:signal transduction histidine kinase